jgi:hypothetical protein
MAPFKANWCSHPMDKICFLRWSIGGAPKHFKQGLYLSHETVLQGCEKNLFVLACSYSNTSSNTRLCCCFADISADGADHPLLFYHADIHDLQLLALRFCHLWTHFRVSLNIQNSQTISMTVFYSYCNLASFLVSSFFRVYSTCRKFFC